MFDQLIKFVKENHALALVLFSVTFTGLMADPGFTSLIVHVINLFLLGAVTYTARQPENNKLTGTILFISWGFTAVMTRPNEWGVIVTVANFFLLMFLWWISSKEKSTQSTKV